MKEAPFERAVGRPLAPAGGKELFLGSGARCGCWESKGACEGSVEPFINESVTGESIDKPEMPGVGVRTQGLIADAAAARATEVGWGAVEAKGRLVPSWWPWRRMDR